MEPCSFRTPRFDNRDAPAAGRVVFNDFKAAKPDPAPLKRQRDNVIVLAMPTGDNAFKGRVRLGFGQRVVGRLDRQDGRGFARAFRPTAAYTDQKLSHKESPDSTEMLVMRDAGTRAIAQIENWR